MYVAVILFPNLEFGSFFQENSPEQALKLATRQSYCCSYIILGVAWACFKECTPSNRCTNCSYMTNVENTKLSTAGKRIYLSLCILLANFSALIHGMQCHILF